MAGAVGDDLGGAADLLARARGAKPLRDPPVYPWLTRLRYPAYVSARRAYRATDPYPPTHHPAAAGRSTVAPTPTRETR